MVVAAVAVLAGWAVAEPGCYSCSYSSHSGRPGKSGHSGHSGHPEKFGHSGHSGNAGRPGGNGFGFAGALAQAGVSILFVGGALTDAHMQLISENN